MSRRMNAETNTHTHTHQQQTAWFYLSMACLATSLFFTTLVKAVRYNALWRVINICEPLCLLTRLIICCVAQTNAMFTFCWKSVSLVPVWAWWCSSTNSLAGRRHVVWPHVNICVIISFVPSLSLFLFHRGNVFEINHLTDIIYVCIHLLMRVYKIRLFA